MQKNGRNKDRSGKFLLLGCIIPIAIFIALLISATIYFLKPEKDTPPLFIKSAEKSVEKKLKTLKKEKQKKYDIDQTVMALFSVKKALSDAKSFEELTPYILQKESDLVATDVASFKYRFFNLYKKMLRSKDDVEEMNSLYDITTGALRDISGMVGYNPVSGFSFDKEQAQQVWHEHIVKVSLERDLKERLYKNQDEMMKLLFEYGKLHSKYISEWNKICSLRDRAYLAYFENDYNEMITSASVAAKLAPNEKEAHILQALALVKRGGETDLGEAETLMNNYLASHSDHPAAAFLLRGVAKFRKGDYSAALIDYDQAATYYPKQQEEVSSILNLYKKRLFLNKSKEGRKIVNCYRSMMSGSGFFSPDFQKARISLKQNETTKAKKKIFDHFFRRRLQGEWDQVLADFAFCQEYLKPYCKDVFDAKGLSLEIEPSWFRNTLIVTVKNSSNKEIHNITLLLCVRFTDMFKHDYISFPVGDSIALLKPGESVQVGRKNITDVTKEKLGMVKEWKDIIKFGAILISDEFITWVAPSKLPPIKEKQSENTKSKNNKTTFTDKSKKIIIDVINSVK